mmetsp:Transcript_15039/g.19047  ORF Transcript_15039/g.19047 Transcript_15039/m.19047 type:complete len:82 (-) Transcript_15039:42-287(-)
MYDGHIHGKFLYFMENVWDKGQKWVMEESILGGRAIISSGGTMRSWSGLMGGPFGPTCLTRTRPPPFFPMVEKFIYWYWYW